MSDAEFNWEALRIVIREDIMIYGQLAAGAGHGAEGNAQRARYAAMSEQALKTLDSMATIEAASPVPGLAEHTPPGQPYRMEPVPAGEMDDWGNIVPGLAEHTAAAQDKIIEASR